MNWPLESRLREVLESDLQAGTLVLGPVHPFVISRTHYAHRLGVSRNAMGTHGHDVLRECEARLIKARARQIKVWLMEQLAAGTLPVRNGVVERKWLQANLGLSNGVLSNTPSFAAVINEANAAIRATGYIPKERADLLARLEETLAKRCPLAPDLLKISTNQLTEQLGTTTGILNQSPYAEVIREKQAELLKGIHLPATAAFFCETAWPFGDLEPEWPRHFVKALAEQFQVSCSGLKNANHHFYGIKLMLRWIAMANHPYCRRAIRAIRARKLPAANDWDDAVHQYAAQLRMDTSQAAGTIRWKLGAPRPLLDDLARGGVLPALTNPIRGVKHASRKARPLTTVAQAKLGSGSGDKEELLKFARDTLRDAAADYHVELSEDETLAFIQVIKEESAHLDFNSSDGIATNVLKVIDKRLGLLKAAALEHFLSAKSKLELGRKLLAQSALPPDFYSQYGKGKAGGSPRHQVMRLYFPDPVDNTTIDRATGNMLRLAQRELSGLFPAKRNTAVMDAVGQFFQKRYLELGGRPHLQEFLTPGEDAVGSVLVMYLIDSGANVSVGLTLPTRCLSSSEAPGYTCITGIKTRAKGKPIFAELRSHAETVQAIQWVRDEAKPLRKLYLDTGSCPLFVRVYGDNIKPLNGSWFTVWFASFVKSIEALQGRRIVPSMIRPSVLMKAVLEKAGHSQLSQAIGQHTLNQAASYQNKYPAIIQRNAQIRKFQHHFESLPLQLVADVQPIVWYDKDAVSKRLKELVPTGLGTFCKDPTAKPSAETGTCTSLDCPGSDCPQSEIVLTPEAAFRFQAWKQGLLEAQPAWERDRPERWEKVWLPWLCLISVIEDQCVTGPLLAVWDEGHQRLTKQIAENSEFEVPCPW